MKLKQSILSKQEKLDVEPKAIQQINFTGNLTRDGNTTIFFIIEEANETVLVFPNGTVKVLQFYFAKIKMTQHNALNVKLYTS